HIQKMLIWSYLDVLVACSNNPEYREENGMPIITVHAVCRDLHGLYCGALYDCEEREGEFCDLTRKVWGSWEPSKELSLATARAVMDKVEEKMMEELTQ
ncbi:hypothetical protein LCGC14_2811820, partial [marine sediment metagenome]